MTDQELAARARDGDQDAFEQLVRDNEKRIYTLALRMTGSREDALDLAQDAFFQAWKALPTFQGESSFATWLYRLATNLCLDHLRTQKRRTQSMGPALSLDDEENGPVQVADQQLQPQEAVERSERRRALERGEQMAVYGDYTQVPDVCSVRSCRYYYPILAVGFDAVYVHWGIDPTIATETINSMEIDHFDADYYGTGKYFGRDKDRINAGYAWEHTGVFYGTKVPEMLEDSNVRTDLKEDKMGTAFKFVEMDKNAAPSGEDAKNIRVDFGANYSTFSYDADKHVYMKNYQNKPHMDCKTNEQLQFENVIVLEADISLRPNDVDGHKLINWEGGENAKGYYISEGKMVPITWSKAGMYDPLKFFDANGNELQLNRGKSYIAFTYAGNCKVEG